ncbi:hypothetical protein FTX61_00290 [Nitriliruptoraceae bacterium ZYF776]|nr:hypothetical protein [Profundirhabdus halotolerans]
MTSTSTSRPSALRIVPPRHAVLAALRARVDDLTRAIAAALSTEVPAGEATAGLSPAVLREVGRRYAELSLRALADDGRLDETSLQALRSMGRERAARHVPLHALLHVVQVGARVTWQRVLDELEERPDDPATRAALTAELSRGALALSAAVTAAVSAGYAEARSSHPDEEDAVAVLWEQLLLGGDAEPLLRRRCLAAGLRLGSAHHVVVAGLRDPAGTPDRERARLELRDALRATAPSGHAPLVRPLGDLEVAVHPVVGPEEVAQLRSTVRHHLLGVHPTHHAACGAFEPGVAGIATSFGQARRTLAFARERGDRGELLTYEATLPDLLLHSRGDLAAEVLRTTVAPLLDHDAERGSDLLATCAALFAAGGNRAEAAKRLHVHRHTLIARLRRIEELTGCALDDDEDSFRLRLGLRAHRLLSGT